MKPSSLLCIYFTSILPYFLSLSLFLPPFISPPTGIFFPFSLSPCLYHLPPSLLISFCLCLHPLPSPAAYAPPPQYPPGEQVNYLILGGYFRLYKAKLKQSKSSQSKKFGIQVWLKNQSWNCSCQTKHILASLEKQQCFCISCDSPKAGSPRVLACYFTFFSSNLSVFYFGQQFVNEIKELNTM